MDSNRYIFNGANGNAAGGEVAKKTVDDDKRGKKYNYDTNKYKK